LHHDRFLFLWCLLVPGCTVSFWVCLKIFKF
jgi:hypothetical protein